MNQILKPSIDKNDYIECEYCKNKLYRKTIEWNLYGTKRVMKLDYERCNCKDAQKYWNEYDMKKLQMFEEEKKLRKMQEFANKVDKIIKNSKMSKRNLNYKFDNFEVNSNNKKVYQSLKNYSEKLNKIAKSNKVFEESKNEKSFYNSTQEKIRKEENRKETRIDESNFETLD